MAGWKTVQLDIHRVVLFICRHDKGVSGLLQSFQASLCCSNYTVIIRWKHGCLSNRVIHDCDLLTIQSGQLGVSNVLLHPASLEDGLYFSLVGRMPTDRQGLYDPTNDSGKYHEAAKIGIHHILMLNPLLSL